MVWLVEDSVNGRCERVGLRLEGVSAASLDLVGTPDDVAEELADVLLDLRSGPEAGVRGDLVADLRYHWRAAVASRASMPQTALT